MSEYDHDQLLRVSTIAARWGVTEDDVSTIAAVIPTMTSDHPEHVLDDGTILRPWYEVRDAEAALPALRDGRALEVPRMIQDARDAVAALGFDLSASDFLAEEIFRKSDQARAVVTA